MNPQPSNMVGGPHQQAPLVGIVNPTPRSNNKTLSTMDLRLLTTQHISNEQKQLYRLSAPLCSHNYIPSNNGQTHHDPGGESNSYMTYNRNESRSNDNFKPCNDAATLFRVPEISINKSKSNMDISSYHRLQQKQQQSSARMIIEERHSSNCTNVKNCAYNTPPMNPNMCCASQNSHSYSLHQNNPMCCLSQKIPMGANFPTNHQQSENRKNSKFRFS